MHLARILSTELHDFRKNVRKDKQTDQQPESRFQCWFALKVIDKNNKKWHSKAGFRVVKDAKVWVLILPDLRIDLGVEAGVGGIGRSRVETYSLDYSIFSKL